MEEICSVAAETIVSNEDLLKQLLLRLPARSLIRFKCVSKHWLFLISTRKFRQSHTLQNHPNPKVPTSFIVETMTLEHCELISFPSGSAFKLFNFIPEPGSIKIMQVCNGLVLCRSYADDYYVVNPTTKECLKLPPLQIRGERICVALAFDPSKSLHYKVITFDCSFELGSSSSLQFEIGIYSSETQSWRVSESILLEFEFPFGTDKDAVVYCNGVVNLLSIVGWLLHYDTEQGHLGVVNDTVYGKGDYDYFGESDGHLHLVHLSGPCFNELNVLEMATDYSGWLFKYIADISLLRAAFPETHAVSNHPFFVFYVADAEENEGENPFLLLEFPGKVVSYDLKDGTFKKICDFRTWKARRGGYYHKETLACV